MITCVNDKCRKCVPEIGAVLVSCDGDFACCQSCADEFHKQVNHFCSVTLCDDNLFEEWMRS